MLTRRSFLLSTISLPLGAASLPEQSAALVLDRGFPDPSVSYLLLDAATGRLICSRWANPEDPVPVGSLVKPFTALAYSETHPGHFPVYLCRGEASHCWLPQGHGRMEIATAISHSCNAYFLELARDVDSDAVADVTRRFGLREPPLYPSPELLIGLGDGWRNSPLAVARAYCELAARKDSLLAGMALSAKSGTGRGIGAGAYAKTGTAQCIDGSHHAGDGFAVALYPTDAPRFALLVRVHGTTGAQAAVLGGKMRAALGGTR